MVVSTSKNKLFPLNLIFYAQVVQSLNIPKGQTQAVY